MIKRLRWKRLTAAGIATLAAIALFSPADLNAGTGSPPPVETIEIRMIGLACGAHLEYTQPDLTVRRGTRIRIVNRTDWKHGVSILREGEADPVVSPDLVGVGSEWTVTLDRPGQYAVTCSNPWHGYAGEHGTILVH